MNYPTVHINHGWVVAVVCGLTGLFAYRHAVAEVSHQTHLEDTVPFYRMSKDDQQSTLAKLESVKAAVRKHVSAAYASQPVDLTPQDGADIEAAGLDRIVLLTNNLMRIPTNAEVQQISDDAIAHSNEAIQRVAISRNGSGVREDDVLRLTRGHGDSSRHLKTCVCDTCK